MNRTLRAIAYVPYPLGRAPAQRYRWEQWQPLLGNEGVDLRLSPFLPDGSMDHLYLPGHTAGKVVAVLRGLLHRFAALAKLREFDVAIVHRTATLLGPEWFERLVAMRKPVVFDFDDAIYLPRASAANAWTAQFRGGGRVRRLCGLAQHVIVANKVLEEYARRYSRRVAVIPSTIDTDREYALRERLEKPRPVIGWTGTHSTAMYLQGIAVALRELRQRADFELRVIGPRIEIPGVELRHIPWQAATEAADLSHVDVGLMPLTDDAWARGKSGMKALQYMALGIPPVVSPVGANTEIVSDGINGFHARTIDDWIDRMLRLLTDLELRRNMGDQARATVVERYSARVNVPLVAQVLHGAVEGSRES